MNKRIPLLLGPLSFVLIKLVPIADLPTEAHWVLALTIWMAIWWVSEAIPLAATALLPLAVLPLTQAVEMKATAQVYSSPIIYLFLGGFTMALSIERWGLHKRLALWIISKAGNSPSSLLLGFMLATALLSMWISNTATTLMLLPIALALLGEMERQGHSAANSRFPQALLLSMAYAASIGGTATLIGTPTNLIFAAASEELLGTSVSFTEWMVKAGPLCLLSFLIAWLYLSRWRYQVPRSQKSDVQALVETQLHELGAVRKEEKWVIGIFGTVVFFWIFRTLLFDSVLPGMTDAGVAIAGALCMFIVPSSEKNQRLLQWEDMKRLPWGILLLFGGGLSLALAFRVSGLADWLAAQFLFMEGVPPFVILLVLVAGVNFLTELTSNVATASVLLPVLASLGQSLGIDAFTLMLACSITASYAFMLPVATAPNAVVFSSGKIPIADMARTGLGLNLISIVIISAYHYFFFPLSV